MPTRHTSTPMGDLRAELTPRAIIAGVLLLVAVVGAGVFGAFDVALAAFILGVIVAPNHWYRGAVGDQSTSMESPGGW